jgi:hypothetical protein
MQFQVSKQRRKAKENNMALKHVGRVKSSKRKVIVAYRVVPGEPENCICVTTENLMAEEHDALMQLVESDSGQSAYEFGEAMARARLPDGRIMLAGFHTTGKMVKMATNNVEMTPDRQTTILLSELNQVIAEQKGVSVEDLALKDNKPKASTTTEEPVVAEAAPSTTDSVLSDEELAAQYRSQADAMFKEAKRLREQAEELVPSKKKTTKKTESA